VGEKEGRAPVSVTFCPRTKGMARSGKSLTVIIAYCRLEVRRQKDQSRALDQELGARITLPVRYG
jgi:hypothetical protein